MSGTPEATSGALPAFAGRYADRLLLLLLTFWAGAIWTIGFVVAPTLFDMIGDRALAGSVAGRLFGTLNLIGMVAGTYAVAYALTRLRVEAFRNVAVWLVLLMVAISLATHFGIQPLLAALRAEGLGTDAVRARFGLWHAMSSGLYVVQSVAALIVVLRLRTLRSPSR